METGHQVRDVKLMDELERLVDRLGTEDRERLVNYSNGACPDCAGSGIALCSDFGLPPDPEYPGDGRMDCPRCEGTGEARRRKEQQPEFQRS